MHRARWTRRQLLGAGAGAVLAGAVGGLELVDHGILPGKQSLDLLDGACSVSGPSLTFSAPGPSRSGTFFSRARNRSVGYTIAYPPAHRPGDELPLVLSLHGYGGDHASGLGGVPLVSALAARAGGRALVPMALVAADGGDGYWNPHPGDDPMRMLVDELIPMCRRLGLGRAPHRVAAIGISMGGYGALLLGERRPDLIAAVAAISPAVWTSYPQARAANGGAFASAAAFASHDVIAHASRLRRTPTRIAAGEDDPFFPGVVTLAGRLPATAIVRLVPGCHDTAFSSSQQHASLVFIGAHVTGAA